MTNAPSPKASPLAEFPPTLREVMLRPRWMGVLLLALLVAGVFAWLGQWQLARSVDFDPPPPGITEDLKPIAQVVDPGRYLPEPLVGQRVQVSGSWISEDFLVVAGRYHDGEPGFWVTGQFRVDTKEPTSLAVGLGWAPTQQEAEAAALKLSQSLGVNAAMMADSGAAQNGLESTDITGRLISDEGAVMPPPTDPWQMGRMSPAMLLGNWHDVDGLWVYRPYLVLENPGPEVISAGLTEITADPPEELGAVNWLNLFYAAEWVVFSGLAFYLWYRLAKDTWEREVEDFEEAAGKPSIG